MTYSKSYLWTSAPLAAQVVLADKDEAKLLATCEEIKQTTGGEAICVVADVSKVCSALCVRATAVRARFVLIQRAVSPASMTFLIDYRSPLMRKCNGRFVSKK